MLAVFVDNRKKEDGSLADKNLCEATCGETYL